jgi:hypothetical protein
LKDNNKLDLMGDCELDSHGSPQGPMPGSSKHGEDLQVPVAEQLLAA